MQKKFLLFAFFMCSLAVSWSWGQTTVLDFEDPATSTTFQYFGSSLDPQLTNVIANPNASGINTSANVMKYVKPADAQNWAGAFSNPNPGVAIDAINNNQICVKIHTDVAESLTVKLENSATGDNWEQTQSTTTTGEWVELCYDLTQRSEATPNTVAAGHVYPTVTIFFGLGTAGNGTDSAVYYMDDMVLNNVTPDCNTILDFEAPTTSTSFQIFGGSLEGVITGPVANPAMDSVNMSDSVLIYTKGGDAPVWGGAFSNPDPSMSVAMASGGSICVKVWMDHIGVVAMKLEGSATGPNWITSKSNTVVNGWEEICFSADELSIEEPFQAAAGHTYTRIVFFIDFGTAGTGSDVVSYLDDFCVQTPAGPDSSMVTFTVDMNAYDSTFTQPYVSGNFNEWSGTANPLSDDDQDGIWTTTVKVANGTLEYKFNHDDWAGQEMFNGTEKAGCTLRTDEFVNRVFSVSEDVTLPTVCYNSCFACGESAKITFNLGLGTAMADEGGIYLAGGGNFDVPGGRFLMFDEDQDGVYTLTIEREIGFSSFYTFANGNCPDFSCKEDISGQDCANPDNFNDRFLTAIMGDTVINTCFAVCSEETNCATGLNDLDFQPNLFNLAPSPVRDFAKISFDETRIHERQVRILSSNGQELLARTLRSSQQDMTLDMQNFATGLYFIQVRIGNLYETKKVLKY